MGYLNPIRTIGVPSLNTSRTLRASCYKKRGEPSIVIIPSILKISTLLLPPPSSPWPCAAKFSLVERD